MSERNKIDASWSQELKKWDIPRAKTSKNLFTVLANSKVGLYFQKLVVKYFQKREADRMNKFLKEWNNHHFTGDITYFNEDMANLVLDSCKDQGRWSVLCFDALKNLDLWAARIFMKHEGTLLFPSYVINDNPNILVNLVQAHKDPSQAQAKIQVTGMKTIPPSFLKKCKWGTATLELSGAFKISKELIEALSEYPGSVTLSTNYDPQSLYLAPPFPEVCPAQKEMMKEAEEVAIKLAEQNNIRVVGPFSAIVDVAKASLAKETFSQE